jgi:hypothetical protein
MGCFSTGLRQAVEFLPPAASLPGWWSHPGYKVPLPLQPSESLIYGPQSQGTGGFLLQFLPNRDTVGFIMEPEDRQQNQ